MNANGGGPDAFPDEPDAGEAPLPLLDGAVADAVYRYTDEAGELLFVVARYPGKQFRQLRHVGGQWTWGLGGARRVLYRLPRLLEHIAANGRNPIYLVEGERDVDAIEAAGGVATCNPMGAGKWTDEHAEALQGARRVVVVADKDEPGRRHAAEVVASLGRVGVVAEVVQAAEGKDAADHVAAGYGVDEFHELELDEPAAEAEPFAAVDLATFLAQPPAPPEWDWQGWYARGDVVLEVGDPGLGKSLNALRRAVTAATGGGEHLGDRVAARRVLFIDLESPEDVGYARLYAFGLRGAVDGFAYVLRPQGFNLLDSESLARLRATIVAHRSEQVTIDSLRRAAPGLDENDSRQVSLVFSALREIVAELGCTIVVVHHPRKPVGDAKVEAVYAARGSGDLIGSVDSYLFYRRLSGGLIRIEHGKARRGREHEHVHFRIVEGEVGEPTIEHVELEEAASDEELLEAVMAFVSEHPGASTKAVEDGVTGRRAAVRKALEILSSPGDTRGESQSIARGPGRHPRGSYWYPVNHAVLQSPGDTGAIQGELSPDLSQGHVSPHSPPPFRAGDMWGDTLDESPGAEEFEWK